MHAIVLAAGLGERLRPHTSVLAKPAIPFLNIPMLAYPLFYLKQAGVRQILINTFHLPQTVAEAVEKLGPKAQPTIFSYEAPVILGSGGGIAQAASLASPGQDFLVANGDAVTLFARADFLNHVVFKFNKLNADVMLVVAPYPKDLRGFGGVMADSEGRVRSFSKQPLNDKSLTPYHFTGFMVMREKLARSLSHAPSNLLYDLLLPRLKELNVQIFLEKDCYWYETGNTKDFLAATDECLKALVRTPQPFTKALKDILDYWCEGWSSQLRELPVSAGGGIVLTDSKTSLPNGIYIENFAVVGGDAILPQGYRAPELVAYGPQLRIT